MLSLTSRGTSTNYVFDYIIDDILKGTIEVFDCVDSSENNFKVFLNVIGFVADYPESSSVVDLMKHCEDTIHPLCVSNPHKHRFIKL